MISDLPVEDEEAALGQVQKFAFPWHLAVDWLIRWTQLHHCGRSERNTDDRPLKLRMRVDVPVEEGFNTHSSCEEGRMQSHRVCCRAMNPPPH